MPTRFASVPHKRAIADRRALAEALAGAKGGEAAKVLKAALQAGREEIARRLEERPWQGSETAAAYAFLTDQIVRAAFDHVAASASASRSDRLLVMAVGGYGRGEMALHSDVDIALVTPAERTRALNAARRAGYTAEGPVWAQAGYIFLTATRQGQRYQLTVAPEGAVYASTPVPVAAPAAAPAR